MRRAILMATALLTLSGCSQLEDILSGDTKLEAHSPFGGLRVVDLVKAPTPNQFMAWGCYDFGGDQAFCSLFGFQSKPKRRDMEVGFDLVFDLYNPNELFPIPLVDLLLALNVYDDSLGVICVNFCDPEDEDCTPPDDPLQACRVDEAETVTGIDDLVPTVDDLLDLAGDIISGDLEENFKFRVIPEFSEGECRPEAEECFEGEVDGEPAMCCDGVCEVMERGCELVTSNNGRTCQECNGHVEAHVQFDMNIDKTLGILEDLLLDVVDGLLGGPNTDLAIPYAIDGTLFFDVPVLGREAIGFGPFEDDWVIE